MIKSYFKIALRNLNRNKIYSSINIAGLSMGLACAMLIILYVKDEVSYDRFHKNVSHIYRVVRQGSMENKAYKDPNTGYLQGPRFTQNVPGIQSFVRVQSWTKDIRLGPEIKSQDLLYVDPGFFSVFSFPLLYGDPASCLKDPHSVVLSEDVAKRQFGTVNAIGKTVMMKDDSSFMPYLVTAVAKRVPQNSSIKFDMLLPIQGTAADAQNSESWFNFFLNTFVVLDPKTDVRHVEAEMQRFYERDSKEEKKAMIARFGSIDWDNVYFLQPFLQMHLSTDLPAQNGLSDPSNPMYTYILSAIALFILIIACINFVNLTIARSLRRAKEIGIRKVVGSDKKQLVLQFLGESFLLCGIAFVFSLLMVHFILPIFNELSNKALALSYLLDARLVMGYVLLFLITGFLAGFYPALILSGYQPVDVLYGRFQLAGKNYLQKSLVILQFSLASFLMIGTWIMYAQFQFLTTKDLGYDDSHVIVLNTGMVPHDKARVFKDELLKNPDITGVASKNGGRWMTTAKVNNDSMISFSYETIDESYLPVLKVPLVAGRNFSSSFPSDSTHSVLVNEAFVKKAGWKNPIGQIVDFFYNKNEKYTVIGVVKDYHYAPLNEEINPQLFTMKNGNPYGAALIRIRPGAEAASLSEVRKAFKAFFPLNPFTYVFKDEENRRSYEAEARWKQILLFGAVLTIFISCIGLFGLSVLSAEKRTKEIGIRKVLGASVKTIVSTLSTEFLALVLIALVIAIPATWVTANKWLQNYPYHITLSWWLFVLSALMVVFISLFTISFQAVKAAGANPVKSLKAE